VAMAYLVLFGSLLGYTAYMYALRNLPVSTVSLYAYVNPVIAMVLGSVVLAEPFTFRIVVASVLVFAGIAIVRRRSRSTERAEGAEGAEGAEREGGPRAANADKPISADPCKRPGPTAYATR
jgi:multidrug transporter EmrE-like cation transporter